MERTDGILRMLKINYASSQDDVQAYSWKLVLKIFTFLDDTETSAMAHYTRGALQYMIIDKDNPNSVLNMVTLLRENDRNVQDHLTKEMWNVSTTFIIRCDRIVWRNGYTRKIRSPFWTC